MDTDIIKFALGVAGVTSAVFIVWLLLREIRLWYWKTNNLIKMLKHINKRLYIVEKKMDELTQEISSINKETTKLSGSLDDLLTTVRQEPLSSDNGKRSTSIAEQSKE